MKFLIRFEDKEALNPDLVGPKFSSLARASHAGLLVPLAVAVSTKAHRLYRDSRDWPAGLVEEIREAVEQLGLAGGLAVRSSAVQEDLESFSFAGQYKTFLKVETLQDLMEKIERCWTSVDTERTRSYAKGRSELSGPVLMGVIIQKMVPARLSGVAFSRNPIYPLRHEVVIEGAEGLGERIVSGHVTPFRAYVQSTGEIRIQNPHQDLMERVPQEKEWHEIAALARNAEVLCGGRPQDIEWAIDQDDTLWLLQSRTITTMNQRDSSAPTGTWTRKIALDLWADRFTPFLADFIIRASPRFDLSAASSFLGIPLITPTMAVINGFLYLNCESIKQTFALIPPPFRTADLRSLFPPGFELEDISPPPLSRFSWFVIRSLLFLLGNPRANPIFSGWITRRGLKKIESRLEEIDRLPTDSPHLALQKVRSALQCLVELLETDQWPYLYATLSTWSLRWYVVDLGRFPHNDFLDLLTGDTDNTTTQMEREFTKIVDMIQEDKQLLVRFMNESPEQLIHSLPDGIQRQFDRFLLKYGYRSRQRSLFLNRWSEAPEELIAMLAGLLRRQPPEVPSVTANHRAKKRWRGQNFPFLMRLGLRPLLRLAVLYLNLREDLRFFLDRILYVIRRSLMGLGKMSSLGEDVFFLTEAQLGKVVDGVMSLEMARDLAAQRRSEFMKPAEPHTFYVDGRPIDELLTRAGLLRGVGTSPGRAKGRARIVDDPTEADIRLGDILIARNTDPGWTPILGGVSGIVVEEGGLLNHCSIVARELGIPAVVGIRYATQKIPEGITVLVDGSLGIVQIVDA